MKKPAQRTIKDPVSVELALAWQAVMNAAFYASLLVAKERGEITEPPISLSQIESICPEAAYSALQDAFNHLNQLQVLLNVPLLGPILEVERSRERQGVGPC